jgi:predicted Zn finger-like uncharacterized protein
MFMDCSKCGTEFIVKDEEIAVMRCPDCLQWIDTGMDGAQYVKAYYGNSKQLDDYDDDYDY